MAKSIEFDDLPVSYLFSIPGFTIIKWLTWYDLTSYTRKGYNLVIKLFKFLCILRQKSTWSLLVKMLKIWAVYCIYSNTFSKQSQIKLKIMASYLFALRSYHINHFLNLEVFNIPYIELIIKSGKRLFPKQKRTQLPIIKIILEKIT